LALAAQWYCRGGGVICARRQRATPRRNVGAAQQEIDANFVAISQNLLRQPKKRPNNVFAPGNSLAQVTCDRALAG
jgi:hypothetical protein